MMQFLEVTSAHTDVNVTILQDFFDAAGWDTDALRSSLGLSPKQRFTLLAPVNSNFEYYTNSEDRERLLSPSWSRHLEDMLKNLLVPMPITRANLEEEARYGYGVYELQMLGGMNYSVYDLEGGDLAISSGKFLEFSSNCTDG